MRSSNGSRQNSSIQLSTQQNNLSANQSLNSINNHKDNFKLYYQLCIRGISHSINIIQALMMRIIFSLHSLIAIGYVYLVKQDEWYLVNIIGVVFLYIELFVTIFKRKGKEPGWYFFN